jgi:hypothetical protein
LFSWETEATWWIADQGQRKDPGGSGHGQANVGWEEQWGRGVDITTTSLCCKQLTWCHVVRMAIGEFVNLTNVIKG